MNLFDLSAKLSLDSADYEKGLRDSEGLGRRFANALSARTVALGQMIGNFASKAVSSVANVTKSLVQNSIQAYADFEQLVGGVETLFGAGGKTLEEFLAETGDASEANIAKYERYMQAQEMVLKNADQAYKTAGLSANEYMETATSFAASLVSSLRGDTVNAAIYADMAVQDMADNANKMGTNISSIQSAYQGFAKQNYTMLDNLKLGYGGTKEEMERLLQDAMKISGRKFNLSSLADIYEAIHIIQQEMGITGTTAKEAEGTISGSINMMKASWENLLTAFGDPDADLNAKIDEFTYSLGKVVGNLMPTFKRVVGNMWNGIRNAATKLPGLVFGKKADGSVNWPTWSTVKDSALSAWEWIKTNAANLAGLVFGKNKDGTVNWPTWDSVKQAAQTAWNAIKSGAARLAGLVFGTKEDGSVAWPSWEQVEAKAKEIWNDIKAKALAIADIAGAIVFGKKEDGTVDWPTWDVVEAKANKIWEGIKGKAKDLAGLVFGNKSNGSVDWPTWSDVKSAAIEAWNKIKEEAANLKGLVLGDSGTMADVFETIKNKWLELKSTIETNVINVASYFFDDANPETVAAAISEIGIALEAIGAAIATYSLVTTLESVFKTIRSLLTFKFTGSSIGMILSGIATALVLIYEHWDDIEPVLAQIGTWFEDNIIKPVQEAIDAIKRFFGLGSEFGEGVSQAQAGKIQEAFNAYVDERNPFAQAGKYKELQQATTDSLKEAGYAEDEIAKVWARIDAILSNSATTDAAKTAMAELLQSITSADESTENLQNALDGLAGDYNINIHLNTFGELPDLSGYSSSGGNLPSNVGYRSFMKNAKGNWNVPYDNFPALLHRNEMVLTASQARRYKSGEDTGINAESLVSGIVDAIKQGMSGVTVQSYLSGRDVTDDVSRNQIRQLKARRFAV